MPVLANTIFGLQFSISQHFDFLSNVTAAYLVFSWHTVLDDLFQMIAYLYAVEQCSAINNLSIASALQLSKSGLYNLKLALN